MSGVVWCGVVWCVVVWCGVVWCVFNWRSTDLYNNAQKLSLGMFQDVTENSRDFPLHYSPLLTTLSL